jgi:membrane dipeptidase
LKQRKENRRITAGLLGIEGAQALDGKIENLEWLFQAGYRYMSLTHFFDDEFAGSSAGANKGGLTPLGHELVRQMNARGMIIDLAHTSPQTIRDVLVESKGPVISSHGGLQGNCNNRRNLSDDEARGIARSGGIIGIGFWPSASVRKGRPSHRAYHPIRGAGGRDRARRAGIRLRRQRYGAVRHGASL